MFIKNLKKNSLEESLGRLGSYNSRVRNDLTEHWVQPVH